MVTTAGESLTARPTHTGSGHAGAVWRHGIQVDPHPHIRVTYPDRQARPCVNFLRLAVTSLIGVQTDPEAVRLPNLRGSDTPKCPSTVGYVLPPSPLCIQDMRPRRVSEVDTDIMRRRISPRYIHDILCGRRGGACANHLMWHASRCQFCYFCCGRRHNASRARTQSSTSPIESKKTFRPRPCHRSRRRLLRCSRWGRRTTRSGRFGQRIPRSCRFRQRLERGTHPLRRRSRKRSRL